jgi:hypothetical protein
MTSFMFNKLKIGARLTQSAASPVLQGEEG